MSASFPSRTIGTSQAASDIDKEAATADHNDLAVAAFVTSLVAFLFVGCLSPISLVFSIVALEKQPRGMAAAALVLSLAGLIPMTAVGLPMLVKSLPELVETQIAFSDPPIAQDDAGEEKPTSIDTHAFHSVRPNATADAQPVEMPAHKTSMQKPVPKAPELRFSDIKQEQKPLGGLGLYVTAENVSNEPVFRFEAIVQFIDKNNEVVAQDRIRETFRKPIAPGQKRELVFTPGIRSPLNGVVPDTCHGSATLVGVN